MAQTSLNPWLLKAALIACACLVYVQLCRIVKGINRFQSCQCSMHVGALQAKTPFAEIQFDFTIAKDYAGDGKLCAVYYV